MKQTFLVFFLFLFSASFCQEVVTVENADQLMKAIGPNKTIQISSDWLFITEVNTAKQGDFYNYNGEGELIITGVTNLKIIGLGAKPNKLVTERADVVALTFQNSKNVELNNLEIGHVITDMFAPGCEFGVLSFSKCKDIKINRCILFGSGTEGIETNEVDGLTCENTIIRGCSNSIMNLRGVQKGKFRNCDFTDNKLETDGISLDNCMDVSFDNCNINLNHYYQGEYDPNNEPHSSLFYVSKGLNISANNCVIIANTSAYLMNKSNALSLNNCRISNNNFLKGNFGE